MPNNIPTYPPNKNIKDNNNSNNADSDNNNNINNNNNNISNNGGGDKQSSHELFQYATTGFQSGSKVFNESDVHSALCYSPFQQQSTIGLL